MKNKYNTLLWALLFGGIIFIVLYNKILFGGYAYMYADIGCDTYMQYYPNAMMWRLAQENGSIENYLLQNGFGNEARNSILEVILNPFGWMSSFVSTEKLYLTFILSAVFRYAWILIFSTLYFQRVFKSQKVVFITALIFTYSGWCVLWGQHYHFATLYAYFIAAAYFLDCFLETRKKGVVGLIIILVLLSTSYYFLYMVGWFCVLYVLYYSLIHAYNIRQTIGKLIQLAMMAVVSILIGLPLLWSGIQNFFHSGRTANVSEQSSSIFSLYSKEYLLSFIGRFFSNNTLGVGNEYSGAYNYYEVAMLSTSLLAGFAIIYLLQSRFMKRTWMLVAAVVLSLISPIATYLFNFDMRKQRWTFMLCFLAVVAIGYFLQDFFENEITKKQMILTLIITDIIYMVLMGVLVISHYKSWIDLDGRICGVIVAVIIIYNVYFASSLLIKQDLYKCAVFVMIMLEIIVMNYPTINNRALISVSDLENGYYNDGTPEAVEFIKEHDGGLYRINKTYISASQNDAQAQGYNGVSVYAATNSKSLINYLTENNVAFMNNATKITSVPWNRYYLNSLLGVKYILSKEELVDNEFYSYMNKIGDVYIYKNEYNAGFGYLYSNELDKTSLADIGENYRDECMLTGFYYTDESKVSEHALKAQDIVDEDGINELVELKRNTITDVVFKDGKLTGAILNSASDDRMLCIPIIYSDKWELYVDGVQTEISDINGGLIGSWITPGNHSIKLEYVSAPVWVHWVPVIGVACAVAFVIIIRRMVQN